MGQSRAPHALESLRSFAKNIFFPSHGYFPLSFFHEVPEPAIIANELSLYLFNF